jgi:hypothetical protein
LAEFRVAGALGDAQQRQDIFRAVRTRRVFAGTALDDLRDVGADVFLAGGIALLEIRAVVFLALEKRVGMKRVRAPNLRGEAAAHRGHDLVVARREPLVEHRAGVNLRM